MKSITRFMQADHDRLDAILRTASAGGQDTVERRAGFLDFAEGLRRHIVWEESILFPLFEARSGLQGGPTAVMRSEHEVIRRLLTELDVALSRGTQPPRRSWTELSELLGSHNQKEEKVLYPWIDEHLTEREAAELIAKMSDVPAR